ncbi:MAG TPA: histidine phosphatase family protein, partial [Thermomicrobiales bacterium]|nr:histidine phosphatase family protein [Thermomicrobiales bacterium]
MTTTFFLVRHGSHERLGRILVGRVPGVRISAEGEAQARRLGERLAREPIRAIYSSPTLRAHQTAEIIAARLGVDLGIEPDLDEVDFGRWTNLSFDMLSKDPLWDVWNHRRSVAGAPGGETMAAVQSRLVACLEALRRRHPGEALVIVGHCDPIRAALLHYLGLSL